MTQMRSKASPPIKAEVGIQVAASLGMLSQDQVDAWSTGACTGTTTTSKPARSFFPQVVTTHTFEERWDTCPLVKESGMELCCGGTARHGRDARAARSSWPPSSRARPVRGAAQLPQPASRHAARRPAGHGRRRGAARDRRCSARAAAHASCATPADASSPWANSAPVTGILGGINALIVGNYLTTLGRDPKEDLSLLADLGMPIKALSETF